MSSSYFNTSSFITLYIKVFWYSFYWKIAYWLYLINSAMSSKIKVFFHFKNFYWVIHRHFIHLIFNEKNPHIVYNLWITLLLGVYLVCKTYFFIYFRAFFMWLYFSELYTYFSFLLSRKWTYKQSYQHIVDNFADNFHLNYFMIYIIMVNRAKFRKGMVLKWILLVKNGMK